MSKQVEDHLNIDTDITVLKAGHHGSDTSTSADFLARTQPRAVVISAGEDNRHGHPHHDVLLRISQSGAVIYRTDRDGSIVFRCDASKKGVCSSGASGM